MSVPRGGGIVGGRPPTPHWKIRNFFLRYMVGPFCYFFSMWGPFMLRFSPYGGAFSPYGCLFTTVFSMFGAFFVFMGSLFCAYPPTKISVALLYVV